MALQPLDQFNLHHTLAEIPGIALVCFTAPHCGACKAMHEALTRLGETRLDIQLFEVNSQRDEALAREFEVFHLPALFIYRQGDYHAPLEAEPRVPKLLQALDTVLNAPAQEAP